MRLLIMFLAALAAYGQIFGPPTRFRSVTVATLPSGVSSGYTVQVTDGASAGDCSTGGGSSVAWCRFNGSSWDPIGDGGSGGGGGAPTSASYLTLGTNGTLTSERVLTCGTTLACVDGLANGNFTLNVDSAVVQTKSNLQSGATLRCASSTGSDDYKCTMTPTLGAYTDGMVVEFEATATANTGAATLEIDNLGGGTGVAIKKCDGSTDPDNSDIAVGRQIALRYDNSVFRLPCNPATVSGSGGVADPGSNGIVARTGSGTAVARSITAGAGITVTNGDGVSGNPTIAVTSPGFGTYASLPTCNTAATGKLYIASDITNVQYLCDGSAWNTIAFGGIKATPPSSSGWTAEDGASGAAAGNLYRITVTDRVDAGGPSHTFMKRALPATSNFTITALVGFAGWTTTDSSSLICGMYLVDASGRKGLFGVRREQYLSEYLYWGIGFDNNFFTSGTVNRGSVRAPSYLYVRYQDDGTDRILFINMNGTWREVYRESRTSTFTFDTSYGFGCSANTNVTLNVEMMVYSIVES